MKIKNNTCYYCKTFELAEQFLKECEEQGFLWGEGEKPTDSKMHETIYMAFTYGNGVTFTIGAWIENKITWQKNREYYSSLPTIEYNPELSRTKTDKKQQIEEMAKTIYESGIALSGVDFAFGLIMTENNFNKLAEAIYKAGYRKEDEVRKEAYKEVLNKVKGLLEGYVDTRDNKNLYIKMCENFGVEVEK